MLRHNAYDDNNIPLNLRVAVMYSSEMMKYSGVYVLFCCLFFIVDIMDIERHHIEYMHGRKSLSHISLRDMSGETHAH